MMIELEPEKIRAALALFIDVKKTNIGCEIQLPLFYPNGDTVTVTISAEKGEYIVHDSGSGTTILNSYGMKVSKKLSQKIAKLADAYGCEFLSGRVSRRCTMEDIGVCAAIVANASRAVGDQILYKPQEPIIDFKTEILQKVKEVFGPSRFRENEEVYGESGYAYRVSAVVLDERMSEPLGFVEPVKDHDTATKKFREFWDISRSPRCGAIPRIALYNDKKHWNRSDLLLLQEVSNVVRAQDAKARMAELARV